MSPTFFVYAYMYVCVCHIFKRHLCCYEHRISFINIKYGYLIINRINVMLYVYSCDLPHMASFPSVLLLCGCRCCHCRHHCHCHCHCHQCCCMLFVAKWNEISCRTERESVPTTKMKMRTRSEWTREQTIFAWLKTLNQPSQPPPKRFESLVRTTHKTLHKY